MRERWRINTIAIGDARNGGQGAISIYSSRNTRYKRGLRDSPMTNADKDKLLRAYSAGKVTWRELRERGFEDYIQVLGGLGELGLRPPLARPDGPNRAARERGRALIREALRARP